MRTAIHNARRLVAKVGSALVTNNGEGLAVEAAHDGVGVGLGLGRQARLLADLGDLDRVGVGVVHRQRRRHRAQHVHRLGVLGHRQDALLHPRRERVARAELLREIGQLALGGKAAVPEEKNRLFKR